MADTALRRTQQNTVAHVHPPTPVPLVPEVLTHIGLKRLLRRGTREASASRSHNMKRAIWSVR